MRRWLLRLLAVAAVARLVGSERIANWVRWADQRLELFSPRGAGIYARVAPRLLAPLFRAVAADVTATQPRRVLDVGTGPGALAIEVAWACSGCLVTGVDLAQEMLTGAGARAREAGVENRVTFEVADAVALPMEAGVFDVAVSTLSLHHWHDPAAVLRELHRVVRPGGRVLIYDLRFSYSRRQFADFVRATPFGKAGFSYATLGGGLPIPVFARYTLQTAAEPVEAAADQPGQSRPRTTPV
jgi:SAM-dependent methyltransferase